MDCRIAHLDLDAFFASVEELLNPSLRGKPIIVGGSAAGRGVVSSASYPARAFGVRSAMPVRQATQLCPSAVLVTPRHDVYGTYSTHVMNILREYSDLVEPISVDEAFVDITLAQSGATAPDEVARALQSRVRAEIGLPCTVGVASSKLLAKMATERGKPGGVVVVAPGQERAFIADRPVEELWGVGARTSERLHALGLARVGQLADAPLAVLEQQFGVLGRWLQAAALGRDERPVQCNHLRRSLSCEHTFDKDVAAQVQLERALLRLSERLARRMWLAHLFARTIRLKLRYSDFETVTRAETLEHTFNLDDEVYRAARLLFQRCWQACRPVRLLGVGAADLTTEGRRQLDLFEQQSGRSVRLAQALNQVRIVTATRRSLALVLPVGAAGDLNSPPLRPKMVNSARRNRLNRALPWLMVVLLGWPATLPLMQPGFVAAHDATLVVYRAAELSEALKGASAYPRWAPDFAFGYGFPIFNYYAPFGAWFALAGHSLGLGIPDCVELLLALSVLGSGLAFYLLARDMFGAAAAFIGAAAYCYAPYHLVDVYFRGDVGETVAFVWAPLILFCTRRLILKRRLVYLLFGSGFYACLILSHNIMALVFSAILVGHVVWLLAGTQHERVRSAAMFMAMVALAFGSSAFFWVPALVERDAVQLGRAFLDPAGAYYFANNFLTRVVSADLLQLYGSFSGGGFRYNVEIGLVQAALALFCTLVIAGNVVWIAHRRLAPAKGSIETVYFVLAGAALLVLQYPCSRPLWEAVPLMAFVQTPWRLLALFALCAALVTAGGASVVLSRVGAAPLSSVVFLGAMLLVLAGTANLAPHSLSGVPTMPSPADVARFELVHQSLGTTAVDEYLPITVLERPRTSPLVVERLDNGHATRLDAGSLSESASSEVIDDGADVFGVRIRSRESELVVLRIFAFPGWHAYVDGAPAPIVPAGGFGLIGVSTTAGEHEVVVRFEDTPVRSVSSGLSWASLLVAFGLTINAVRSRERTGPNDAKLPGICASVALCACLSVAFVLVSVVAWVNSFPSVPPLPEPVSYRSDIELGEQVRILGVSVSEMPTRPAERVPLTVYWQEFGPIDRDLSVFVHLVGFNQHRWAQVDTSGVFGPGGPKREYGAVIVQNTELELPPDLPPGVYTLIVGLYDSVTYERLPILTRRLAAPLPDLYANAVAAATIDVRRPERSAPPMQTSVVARLDDFAELAGIDAPVLRNSPATIRAGESLTLTLRWRALRTTTESYTVFIHLLGVTVNPRDGSRVWSQVDRVPLWGTYPTNLWQRGEVVSEIVNLSIPADAPSGDYQLEVGMYSAAGGGISERLPVFDGSGATQGDRVLAGMVAVVR